MSIERLRALEKKWREMANDRANAEWVTLVNCANDLRDLIAELGQEVGAVADDDLSAVVDEMRTCARWYAGTYAADRATNWADRLACIQSSKAAFAPAPLMAARETEDDGAAIMGRLARALAKADPSSKLPRMAIDWLRSKGIHWKSHCPTDPLHDFGHPVTDNKSVNQLRQIRYRFDYSGTFEDADRCAAIDAAIAALTSPAHTSEARDAGAKLDEVSAYVIELANECDDLYDKAMADGDQDWANAQVARLTAINQIGLKIGCIQFNDAAMRQEGE